MPRRGPFDGSDWSADPVGTSRRTARRCTTTERTMGRRREEIKGGPLGGSLGSRSIEEGNARSRGTKRADHRRAAPPATSVVRLLPFRDPLSGACRGSVDSSICVPLISNPPLSIHSCRLSLVQNSWIQSGIVSKFQSTVSIVLPSSPARDFNERYSVSGSSRF